MNAHGPDLAAALGGTWDDFTAAVTFHGATIWTDTLGRCWLDDGADTVRLGSFSDGVESLAKRARELMEGERRE